MLFRAIIAATAMLTLAACQDEAAKERACFDRINADLKGYADWASARGDHDGAMEASLSNVVAATIYSDDDRSICDYVTDGPELERK